MTYKIWAYESVDLSGKPIPKRVLVGGMEFPNRKTAEEYWYDSEPGCNDKAIFLPARQIS